MRKENFITAIIFIAMSLVFYALKIFTIGNLFLFAGLCFLALFVFDGDDKKKKNNK